MTRVIGLLIVVWQVAVTSVLAQTSEKVSIPVEGQRAVSGEIWLPSGGGTAPAVLVLHTAGGYVESFDAAFARALAEAGYVALAVNYGSREDRRREGWREASEKALLAVAHWLSPATR
jgi:dienelactone hydrolase